MCRIVGFLEWTRGFSHPATCISKTSWNGEVLRAEVAEMEKLEED